jgi:hypothetical protein
LTYVIGITMPQAQLSGRLDHVAVGSSRHHAILHFAGRGQIARQPHPDGEQDSSDDEPGDGAAAVVASPWFAHRMEWLDYENAGP